jgi:Fic/DOC family
LLRIAAIHVQFETIHPYLDGNGRVGRMLIALLLEHWQLLSAPLLYMSAYLKEHQSNYYRHLERVRTDGDWTGWFKFFLLGIESVARGAADSARRLQRQVTEDRLLNTTKPIAGRAIGCIAMNHTSARLCDGLQPDAHERSRDGSKNGGRQTGQVPHDKIGVAAKGMQPCLHANEPKVEPSCGSLVPAAITQQDRIEPVAKPSLALPEDLPDRSTAHVLRVHQRLVLTPKRCAPIFRC